MARKPKETMGLMHRGLSSEITTDELNNKLRGKGRVIIMKRKESVGKGTVK